MDAAKTHKWKVTKSLDVQGRPATQVGLSEQLLLEYSYDAFVQYLIHFIVTDDQVSIVLTRTGYPVFLCSKDV